jgi:cobalt-zinc-cadmium efflux system membrane fusion protein
MSTQPNFGLFILLCSFALAGCGAPGESDDEHGEEHEERGEEHDEDGEEHATEVSLTGAAITRAGITTGMVSRAPLGGGAGVPAELVADPAYTAHVGTLVSGRVTSASVSVGDRVEAGAVLAIVASADVGASRAAAASARVRRDAARATRDRHAALVESGIGARRTLMEADAALAEAEAELRGVSGGLRVVGGGSGSEVTVTAPITGVIIERHATAGEVVEADVPLFVITDPAHLWVVGYVPELDLAVAREGAPASLSVAAFPGERWSGHIDFVAPALDEATRTLGVRAILDAPETRLRAGLFGRLTIAGDGAEATALVVPASALARVDGEDVVFVPADEERTFRPVPVRLGRRDGEIVEILEGLEEGAPIVTSGAFTLRSELSRSELAEHEH